MPTAVCSCSTCGKQFRVTPEQVGRKVRCPHCEAPNSIPSSIFEAPAQPPQGPGPDAELSSNLKQLAASVKETGLRSYGGGGRTHLDARVHELPPYWALLVFDWMCVVAAVVTAGLAVLALIGGVIAAAQNQEDPELAGFAMRALFNFAGTGLASAFGLMVLAHWTRLGRDSGLRLAELLELQKRERVATGPDCQSQ